MRIGFPEMEDKVGHEVRSDGRQDADAQIAVHAVCFIGYHFLYALGFIQHNLCLTDDFSPMRVGVIFFRSRLKILTSSSSSSF